MANNANLHNAKNAKNDEFYTRYNDIAEELQHYKSHFKNKVIFCNCDDPKWSKFWQYFVSKYDELKYKRLISTHYNYDGSPSYALIYDGEDDSDGNPITQRVELQSNGDFSSPECVDFLKASDIVVTNPPFSIARQDFVPLLMKYDKKFLIIGDDNWCTYKNIFPLLQQNIIWKGFNHVKEFLRPDGTTKKYGNKSWYTNLDNEVRHKKLILLQDYDINDYPKYDNYDAIDIGYMSDKGEWKASLKYIPDFYDGIMGVPITFLDKYNPEQFEIIGFGQGDMFIDIGGKGATEQFVSDYYAQGNTGQISVGWKHLTLYVNGKALAPYQRILIKRKDL